jgi:hypothetical protein
MCWEAFALFQIWRADERVRLDVIAVIRALKRHSAVALLMGATLLAFTILAFAVTPIITE